MTSCYYRGGGGKVKNDLAWLEGGGGQDKNDLDD